MTRSFQEKGARGKSHTGVSTRVPGVWAGRPGFYVDIAFRTSMEESSQGEGGLRSAVVSCLTELACWPVESAPQRLGWGGGSRGAAGEGGTGPLESVRLSCRCRTKRAQNGSVTAPQSPGRTPAERETDCAQINIPCSVRGSGHERLTLQSGINVQGYRESLEVPLLLAAPSHPLTVEFAFHSDV